MEINGKNNLEGKKYCKSSRYFTDCITFACLYFLVFFSFIEVMAQTAAANAPQETFILTKEEQIWISQHPVIRVTKPDGLASI